MAVWTKNSEMVKEARDSVVKSTFLQFMVLMMVIIALAALIGLPLFAALFDIPLFVTLEFWKETGALFWKSSVMVTEVMQINGLWLDPEFAHIVQGAISMVFGNVVAGMGRR